VFLSNLYDVSSAKFVVIYLHAPCRIFYTINYITVELLFGGGVRLGKLLTM